MPRGVIFDLDGVLIASGPAHQASWRLVARAHGRNVSPAEFAETFGRPSRDIIRLLFGEHVGAEEMRRIDDEKEHAYRDLVRGMVPLMIGARETLAALRAAGLILSIATSGPPENLDLVVDEARIREYFAALVHGFDIAAGKPAPDCFLLAAQRCALPPSRCVVVEDAPVGIEAARAAGMPAIALIGTHPADRLRAAGASIVIDRLAELTPELVLSLA